MKKSFGLKSFGLLYVGLLLSSCNAFKYQSNVFNESVYSEGKSPAIVSGCFYKKTFDGRESIIKEDGYAYVYVSDSHVKFYTKEGEPLIKEQAPSEPYSKSFFMKGYAHLREPQVTDFPGTLSPPTVSQKQRKNGQTVLQKLFDKDKNLEENYFYRGGVGYDWNEHKDWYNQGFHNSYLWNGVIMVSQDCKKVSWSFVVLHDGKNYLKEVDVSWWLKNSDAKEGLSVWGKEKDLLVEQTTKGGSLEDIGYRQISGESIKKIWLLWQ